MRTRPMIIVLAPPAAWSFLAILWTPWAGAALRGTACALYVAALAASIALLRRSRLPLVAVVAAGLVAGVALRSVPRPSNERAWVLDQSRLTRSDIQGDRLTVRNIRAFRHRPGSPPAAAWEDRSYDLAKLDSAWLAVSPFSSLPGVGHVFISFGFEGGEYLAVSVEARKEAGERYSPWRGLFRSYEVMYVVGRESDLMSLRADIWGDPLYLYPVRATPAQARATLLSMLGRANDLAARPEFYDTIASSCSSNLARHVNEVAPGSVPSSVKILLAGLSDALALELGLLDVEGDIASARARHRVVPGIADPGAADYSRRIRPH